MKTFFKIAMKIIICRAKEILLVVWILLICAVNFFSQENNPPADAAENRQKICAPTAFGLRFCLESSSTTFKLGEPVKLQFSLTNVSGEAMEVGSVPEKSPAWRCCAPYDFKVQQADGRPLPTILDELIKKSVNGTITEKESEEQFLRCCFNRGSRWGNTVPLDAGKGYTFDVNLSENYNFTTDGQYFVLARRNVAVTGKNEVEAIDLPKIKIIVAGKP